MVWKTGLDYAWAMHVTDLIDWRRLLGLVLFVGIWMGALPVSTTLHAADEVDVEALSLQTLLGSDAEKQAALEQLIARGEPDIIPTLVHWMRWGGNHRLVAHALHKMTGERLDHWHDAQVWLETHPEITPHPSFRRLQLRFWGNTDERFRAFFEWPNGKPKPLILRFEEIHWGGVVPELGIPALDNPPMINGTEATYLNPDDLVFGTVINGDARAYPLRIMGWHEMMNDVVGGVPVALAYCTLCAAGILYETGQRGDADPVRFYTSGLLYRSNKLMADHGTHSLWNQFTGEPVAGELVGKDIQLKIRPLATTTWSKWLARHPDTTVLSLYTGFVRDYGSGVTYRAYFDSDDLMFPAHVADETEVRRKEQVFGLRLGEHAKAWPLDALWGHDVLNDHVGGTAVVLLNEPESRTVRAYARGANVFVRLEEGHLVDDAGQTWWVKEDTLETSNGETLPRLPGHLAYWFAWSSFLGAAAAPQSPK